ncbi:MAG: tetratricopeptide repeat protein [Planctomycetota bacterium]|jgi:tetratricopeptide (TPR) repeat protein
MKHLPLKLGIAVVLFFTVLITACLIWTPVRLRYYLGKFHSDELKVRAEGITGLVGMGQKGKDALVREFPKGEEAARFLVEHWEKFDPEADLQDENENSTLRAAAIKEYGTVILLMLAKGGKSLKEYEKLYYARLCREYSENRWTNVLPDSLIVLAMNPKFADVYRKRGYAKEKTGDLEGGIKEYDKALYFNPNEYICYNNRGYHKYVLGDIEGAIKDYTKAIELEPEYKTARLNRRGVRMEKGDYDGAIADCTKLIELEPETARYHLMRGSANQEKGDMERAYSDFTRAIELDPDYTEAYVERGYTSVFKSDFDEAIADCNRAIKLNPDYDTAYHNRGIAKEWEGDYKGALADYNNAIEMNPNFGGWYTSRGYLFFDTMRFDEALADFRKTIELEEPGHKYSAYSLFRICIIRMRKGEAEAARREAGAYMKVLKKDSWLEKIAGFHAGEVTESQLMAATESENAKIDRERKCEAYFYIAEMALADGKKEKAMELFRKSVETGVKYYVEHKSSKCELERLTAEEKK